MRQRRDEGDERRLMNEIDREAVAPGDAESGRQPATCAPARRRGQFCERAWETRRRKAEQQKAAPRQERTPVERIGQRVAEPDPQEDRRIERLGVEEEGRRRRR